MTFRFLKLPDSLAQIKGTQLKQLLRRQVEIKDIQILDKMGVLGSFWNGHRANVDL